MDVETAAGTPTAADTMAAITTESASTKHISGPPAESVDRDESAAPVGSQEPIWMIASDTIAQNGTPHAVAGSDEPDGSEAFDAPSDSDERSGQRGRDLAARPGSQIPSPLLDDLALGMRLAGVFLAMISLLLAVVAVVALAWWQEQAG